MQLHVQHLGLLVASAGRCEKHLGSPLPPTMILLGFSFGLAQLLKFSSCQWMTLHSSMVNILWCPLQLRFGVLVHIIIILINV